MLKLAIHVRVLEKIIELNHIVSLEKVIMFIIEKFRTFWLYFFLSLTLSFVRLGIKPLRITEASTRCYVIVT